MSLKILIISGSEEDSLILQEKITALDINVSVIEEQYIHEINDLYDFIFLNINSNVRKVVESISDKCLCNVFIIKSFSDDKEKQNFITEYSDLPILDVFSETISSAELNMKIKSYDIHSNSIYKKSFYSMDTIGLLTNDQNEVLFSNDSFKNETGYTLDEVFRMKISRLSTKENSVMFFNNMLYTLKAGLPWHGLINTRKKDGTCYLDNASIVPINHNKKTYYMKTSLNVTKIKEIESENERALRLAESIQHSMLPEEVFDEDIIIQSIYKPLENVCGDIFYWYKINKDTYCILLADAIGHGVGSALMTTSIMAFTSELIKENHMPDVFLQQLNNKMMGLYKSSELSQTNFFTVAYIVIDLSDKKIHYANCGHPQMYLLNDKKLKALNKPNFLMGLFLDADFSYDTTEYDDNSNILLYTDGLTELEPGMKGGRELLEERLTSFTTKNSDGISLIKYLDKELIQNRNKEISDDISVITVNVKGR